MSEDDDQLSLRRVPAGVTDDPQFLRKYELERELGVGGAGVVFRARHRDLDERVAIKFLLSGSENAEAMVRFRREARAANRVKSEHVVRIIDVSTTQSGVPFVVMEYLEGTDLERLLLESPDAQLPVHDAIEFVLQACEALAECHVIGIVHRDLKPSNLFCTHGADGLASIKVLDFGISKLGSVTVNEAMTGGHAIMGSPRYMSPEQFATPADVDQRSDIWAIGVILYELVTGAAPFVGTTVIAIWERVKGVAPKPIEELRRDTPRGLAAIVMRCLEKEPADRYQNVAELAKALLPLASDRARGLVARIVRIVEAPGVTTTSLSLPPSDRASGDQATSVSVHGATPPWRLSGPLVVAALLAAAALVAGIASRQPTPSPSHNRPAPSRAPAEEPSPRATLGQRPLAPTVATTTTTPPSGRLERGEPRGPAPSTTVAPAANVASPRASPRPKEMARPAEAPSSSSNVFSAEPSAAPAAAVWIVDIAEHRKGSVGEKTP